MSDDDMPTETFTAEQIAAAYREALAGVPDDLPTAQELTARFKELGTTDPFGGQ